MATKKNIRPHLFWKNFLFKQNNYSYLIKDIIITALWLKQSLFEKSTFYDSFTTQTNLEQSTPFQPKPKKKNIFFWHCNLKAECCSISEHPRVLPWPNNLMKKLLCDLRLCSFTAPKNCTFRSISEHKTIFTMKKEKQHSK